MIKKLRLKNFKNFKDAELSLGPFTVLIGENASGKSNLRDAFRFLHGISLGYSLADIFGEKRVGGTVQWSGIRGGMREITYLHEKSFVLEVTLSVDEKDESDLFTYFIQVEPGELIARPKVINEWLRWKQKVFSVFEAQISRSNPKSDSDIYVTLPDSDGKFYKSNLFSSYKPILKQIEDDSSAYEFVTKTSSFLEGVRFFEFFPDVMRLPSFPGQTLLGEQGENLSSVLQAICENEKQKQALVEWLHELTPMDAVGFEFIPDQTGKILVNLIEANGEKISAYSASDGTLRFLGILAALFKPESNNVLPSIHSQTLLFFEELETGIHPSRLHLLVQLIEQQTREQGIQVIATTHSPQLLRLLSQESLADAALLYRLPDSPEAHIKQFRDFPEEAQRIIKENDVGYLHETKWFEITTHFMEGEPAT